MLELIAAIFIAVYVLPIVLTLVIAALFYAFLFILVSVKSFGSFIYNSFLSGCRFLGSICHFCTSLNSKN